MSALFALASKAAQRAAMRKFGGMSTGRLLREARKASRSGGGQQLLTRLGQLGGSRAVRNAKKMGRQGVMKYALDQGSRQGLDALYRQLGPVGQILKSLLESPQAKAPGVRADVQAAMDLLRSFGHETIPPKGTAGPARERGLQAAMQALSEEGLLGGPETRGMPPAMPEEQATDAIMLPEEEGPTSRNDMIQAFENEIRTPGSSNVYGFSFQRESRTRGILYVTYQAPILRGSRITKGPKHGIPGAISGSRGAYARGGSGKPGAMYGYYNVPVSVYQGMKNAASAGKFVWDKLRVRGTIEGHQYQYNLVDAATIVQNDVTGEYIPRKATKRGFVKRSLAIPGTGKRAYWESTLPAQNFRSTPDRASPDRATPNRGR